MSLWRFDHTEPPRTKPPRTHVAKGMQTYREGSSEFREVRIHLTSSNHCEEGESRATGNVRVSSERFDPTEPLRTTVTKGEAGLQGRFD